MNTPKTKERVHHKKGPPLEHQARFETVWAISWVSLGAVLTDRPLKSGNANFGWILDPSITSSRPQRLRVCSFLPGHKGPGRIECRMICLNVVGVSSTISARPRAAPYPSAQSCTGRHNFPSMITKFPAGRALVRSTITGLLACGSHGPHNSLA